MGGVVQGGHQLGKFLPSAIIFGYRFCIIRAAYQHVHSMLKISGSKWVGIGVGMVSSPMLCSRSTGGSCVRERRSGKVLSTPGT